MEKITLDKKTKYLNVIVHCGCFTKSITIDDVYKALIEFCENNFTIYAFILHDKDVDDNGLPKIKHFHIVGVTKKGQVRLSTWLNIIADVCCVPNLAVSIGKANLVDDIQYLIHANNKDKYQYSSSDIVTNLGNELDTYLYCDVHKLDFELLKSICKSSNTFIDVADKIGLQSYLRYRSVISDLMAYYKSKC